MKSEITRAKYLILNGRFQNKVTKQSNRYTPLDSKEKVAIGGQTYTPFYDTSSKQVVFGYVENNRFYSLVFSNADYNFGSGDAFEWFDA